MFDKLRIGKSAKQAKKFTPIHPDISIGKKHGISLMLHGKHSIEYRNAIAGYVRRTSKRELSIDEQLEQSVKLIVSCCTGWEGVTDKSGKLDPYSSDKLFNILIDDDFRWMRIQAELFQTLDDNFF